MIRMPWARCLLWPWPASTSARRPSSRLRTPSRDRSRERCSRGRVPAAGSMDQVARAWSLVAAIRPGRRGGRGVRWWAIGHGGPSRASRTPR
jgi:hypothetical protein